MTEFPEKDKILDRIEQQLRTCDDFFLPLKKLGRDLQNSLPPPPLEELRRWVEEDRRFEVFPAPEGLGGDDPEREQEMETRGFFSGPRVGLVDRRPTPEQIAEKLQEHTSRLLGSLQKAYVARPDGGPEAGLIEDKLLNLLQKAQKLQEQLSNLTVPRPPQDSEIAPNPGDRSVNTREKEEPDG
jgi:hypothetical protein